jgi:hypothetical protein
MKRFTFILVLVCAVLVGMAFAFVPQSFIQVGISAIASGNFSVAPPYATDGTNFYGNLYQATKMNNGSFTWINQSTATITAESAGTVVLNNLPNDNAFHLRTTAAPSTPYGIEMRFEPLVPVENSTSLSMSISFNNGTGIESWEYVALNGGGTQELMELNDWTNATTFSAQVQTTTIPASMVFPAGVFLAECDYGTTGPNANNVAYGHSPDGIHWIKDVTRSRTAFLGSGPTAVSFGGYTNGVTIGMAVDSWFSTGCPF